MHIVASSSSGESETEEEDEETSQEHFAGRPKLGELFKRLNSRSRLWKASVVGNLLFQVIAVSLPCIHGMQSANSVSLNQDAANVLYATLVVSSTLSMFLFVAFELIWASQPSSFSEKASLCFLLGWLRLTSRFSHFSTAICLHDDQASKFIVWSFSTIESFTNAFLTFVLQGAMASRVSVIETSFGQYLRSRILFRSRAATFAAGLITSFLKAAASCPCWQFQASVSIEVSADAAFQASRGVSYAIIAASVRWAVDKVITAMSEASSCGGYLMAEATWVQKVIRRQQLSIVISAVFCSVVFMAKSIGLFLQLWYAALMSNWAPGFYMDGTAALLWTAADLCVMMVEATCLCFICGVGSKQRPDIVCIKQSSTPSMQTTNVKDKSEAWKSTVRELAERSISVSALLDFYERLGPGGQIMLHYNPERSTTNDVVRQAIIPLSRSQKVGGVSYACAIQYRRLPDAIVTHSWSGLFLHLVAAVVADALDKDVYGHLAHHLAKNELLDLREELQACNGLHRTYWICAFCVNQHSGICAGFGKPPQDDLEQERWEAQRRDSVTGEVFPICNCHRTKFFNDVPDQCEMNKFDCMMAYLQQENTLFQQTIAVDDKFTLFERAWCVAEIVQGHVSGIPQKVRLHSERALDIKEADLETFAKLATLSVTKCRSSRPQDREEILARISHVAEFDAQLQFLIFGKRGLLKRHFDGFDLVEAAALAARRVVLASKTVQLN